MNQSQMAEKLKQAYGGPMSEEEVQFFRDMQAFIDFAVRNGLSFLPTMATLSHDLHGLNRWGFDLEEAKRQMFSPRVSGYSQIDSDSFGEPE